MLFQTRANSKHHSIVFDLDGTLVNSSKGIINSLSAAIYLNDVTPARELSEEMIGPPLHDIVTSMFPSADAVKIKSIIASFQHHYDSTGCLSTVTYDGIESMLQILNDSGYQIFVATNKRLCPTMTILEHLGLISYLCGVYCIDSSQTPYSNKTSLLAHLLHNENLDPSICAYIGDRVEDWYAARDNLVRFGWAMWGYSPEFLCLNDNSFSVAHPDGLLLLKLLDDSN